MGKPDSHRGWIYRKQGKKAFSGIERIGCASGRSPKNHDLKDALILKDRECSRNRSMILLSISCNFL